jgi:AraC-like DNA-binding protein
VGGGGAASMDDDRVTPSALAMPSQAGEVFRTEDIDEIREEMSRVIHPHVVAVASSASRIEATKTQHRLGELLMLQLTYGAAVHVTADSCGPLIVMKTPVAGSARIAVGRQVVESNSARGAILIPDVSLDFSYSEDCTQFVLGLQQERLHRHCAQLLGEAGGYLDKPLTLDAGMDLTNAGGQQWLRLLKYLRDEAVRGEASLLRSSPLALAPFEQMLMTTLLTIQPSNYSDLLRRPVSRAAPYYVRRAEDYIRAHADEALTMVEIAARAGISPRALFRGFHEFRGTSPMAYLKVIRLQWVHDELLAAVPGSASVTEVALRWGFAHLGHFGQDYKRRFGETPAETLRRW